MDNSFGRAAADAGLRVEFGVTRREHHVLASMAASGVTHPGRWSVESGAHVQRLPAVG
jgi:hypothetical protein